MDMQTLYNHLRVKRKYGRGDVVVRLSYEEMDLIFEAFEEAGVSQEKGSEYVALIDEINRQKMEDVFDEKKAYQAYDGLRAKVNTGTHKDAVGIVYVTTDTKKPFHIVFPSGNQQKYAPGQFEVIAKDKQKYEEKLKAIVFTKGADA